MARHQLTLCSDPSVFVKSVTSIPSELCSDDQVPNEHSVSSVWETRYPLTLWTLFPFSLRDQVPSVPCELCSDGQVPDVEVNCEDLKGESTPLYYAALAGNERAVGRTGDNQN